MKHDVIRELSRAPETTALAIPSLRTRIGLVVAASLVVFGLRVHTQRAADGPANARPASSVSAINIRSTEQP